MLNNAIGLRVEGRDVSMRVVGSRGSSFGGALVVGRNVGLRVVLNNAIGLRVEGRDVGMRVVGSRGSSFGGAPVVGRDEQLDAQKGPVLSCMGLAVKVHPEPSNIDPIDVHGKVGIWPHEQRS